ncbi:MAG: hypoxanthine phosphoribosyltransferase [Chloroflexota bacterium]|nr:MAG: hypoxanthine phosphoribosyltransferase [Chloroflexota bacterium]
MQDYHEFLADILIPKEILQKRVMELGVQISQDYAGKEPILICILRGGVMFLTDLMRSISIPHSIEFMAVSSYGSGRRESSGSVRITLDLGVNIESRHVILVEDIIDSGRTISSVLELLSARHPDTLRVCTLLDKAERREVEVPIAYRGFTIPDRFVFGYGLDIDEFYRNLPFIGVVDLARYNLGTEPVNDEVD